MLKKAVILTITGVTLAWGIPVGVSDLAPSFIAYADYYDDNLWGDSNYELVYGHMGVAYYIDWSSFVLISDSGIGPGQPRFAVNVVSYDVDQNEIVGTRTYEYIKSRNGTFTVDSNGNTHRFDENEEYGYNAVIIETYKRCMTSLRD